MAEDRPEFTEQVACPNCGKPVPIGKMNVCYLGRYDCPHCGAVVLIEGDKITVEKDDPTTR
jgi:endogenous inhibitor of DNA gyrase (YacG/DUF329 family)